MATAVRVVRAVILGAPGSGKGTVSSRIVAKYGFVHVSSGDALRRHVRERTDIGRRVEKHLNAGTLVPDEVMMRLVSTELGVVSASWLLDGFPRTATQAENLSNLYPIRFALNLEVPFDVIVERVKGRWVHPTSGRVYNMDFNAPKTPGKDDSTGEPLVQRPDDRPEAIKRRLEIYKETTEPVIEFYKRSGLLQQFYGTTTDEIWPQVVTYLDSVVDK